MWNYCTTFNFSCRKFRI